MKIHLDDCISCALCVPECPDGGIYILQEDVEQFDFTIDPNKCTECIEFNKKSKCSAVCPTDCIDNRDNAEPDAILWMKHHRNKLAQQPQTKQGNA